MRIKVAIVADDLTGALDTAAPFALRGLRVAAAVRPEGLEAAVQSGADVVVVNTASRGLAPDQAARQVEKVAEGLAGTQPGIVLKKIDSRLKGNVRAEIAALAGSMGYADVVVAPAIPDQQRVTLAGAVAGRGVAVPIPVAPVFGDDRVRVEDAASDADMDRIVAARDWATTLAAGARGLGAAFARRLGAAAEAGFSPHPETLFAVGSRDPLTEAQMARLGERHPGLAVVEAPCGALAAGPPQLPALLRCTGEFLGPDETVSRRFAAGVMREVARLQPHTLLLCGGDTALAVLDRLGVALVFPEGEAAPGLPWFRLAFGEDLYLRCVVKSGGFGDADALARLLPGAGSTR